MELFKSFFPKKNKVENPRNEAPPKTYIWIVNHLSRLEGKLTQRQKWITLAIFAISSIAFFIRILIHSFSSAPPVYHIGNKTIITPIPAFQQDKRGFEWLLNYNRFLDSLKSDSNGVKIYHQMRSERPGLIDTVEMAGQFIKEQN